MKTLIEQCQTPGELQYFYKEVKLLMMLRHPNIVTFLGGCMRPPNLCIIQVVQPAPLVQEHLEVSHIALSFHTLFVGPG